MFVAIETSAFSGATLLALLLNAHPQIASIGEMDGLIARENPMAYRCSCGQLIMECAFWRQVGAAMDARGFMFDVAHFDTQVAASGSRLVQTLRAGACRSQTLNTVLDRLLLTWPPERRRLLALAARNEAFIEAVLEVTGKQVFVDTSKDRLRLGMLRRLTRLDVRAIHLIRDARGVVASRLQRGSSLDAGIAARQWSKLHSGLDRALRALPHEKRIRIRYEDLCREPAGVLERVYRLCEVGPALYADLQAAQHHIIGNAMRLNSLAQIQPDERWRRSLTPEQLLAIESTAGKTIRQFGY